MTTELETKRAAVVARKRELANATEGVRREQKQVDAKLFHVQECERVLELARDRAAYDAAAAALDSARIDHGLALKRLHDLIEKRVHAEAQAGAAERAVAAHVDLIFSQEESEEVRKVAHHLDEAFRLGMPVLVRAIAGEINNRTSPLPEVTKVLERLETPLIDRHKIGSNFLRGEGDTAALARRAARRAALIASEETAPHESPREMFLS